MTPTPPVTTDVTVIGGGPMGRALAGALLDDGLAVSVWNRTHSRVADVVDRGAQWEPDPTRAVVASPVTLVCVVDHAALDTVVRTAGESVRGRDVVGLTADTPDRARSTAALVLGAGGRYLDGAVMTPVETIGTERASVLLAGPEPVAEAHRRLLGRLGRTTWVGPDPGLAAAYDVALLDLFWTSIGAYLHATTLARAEGIDPTRLLPHVHGILDILPPITTDLAQRIQQDRHGDASAALDSVAASVGHLVSASAARGLDTAALDSLARSLSTAVDAGHGRDEVSRLAALPT